MKKHFVKLLTLVIFASIGLQSCSVAYRENRHKRDEQRQHDRDHDHDHDNNHNYRNY
jgi:ABC-type Zn2+ transport system substrate-binding protein/surface adhesin